MQYNESCTIIINQLNYKTTFYKAWYSYKWSSTKQIPITIYAMYEWNIPIYYSSLYFVSKSHDGNQGFIFEWVKILSGHVVTVWDPTVTIYTITFLFA